MGPTFNKGQQVAVLWFHKDVKLKSMRKLLVVAVIYDHSKLLTDAFMLSVDSLNPKQAYHIKVSQYVSHQCRTVFMLKYFYFCLATPQTADHWVYKQPKAITKG